MSAAHYELAPGVTLPASAVSFTYSRAGGPGGQHVNKTSTRATLTVALDELLPRLPDHAAARLPRLAGSYLATDRLVIHAGSSRSQHANRQACVDKLAALVRRSLRKPKTRRPTKPSKRAVERRLQSKQQRGQRKRDRKPPSNE